MDAKQQFDLIKLELVTPSEKRFINEDLTLNERAFLKVFEKLAKRLKIAEDEIKNMKAIINENNSISSVSSHDK